MGINNFKKLEELEMEQLEMRSELVKSNISANLGSVRFLTNIVELYFPRIVELFVGMTGGSPGKIKQSDKTTKSKYPDLRN